MPRQWRDTTKDEKRTRWTVNPIFVLNESHEAFVPETGGKLRLEIF